MSRLANEIARRDNKTRPLRIGTITAVTAAGSSLREGPRRVASMAGYEPVVGDQVVWSENQGVPLILGALGAGATRFDGTAVDFRAGATSESGSLHPVSYLEITDRGWCHQFDMYLRLLPGEGPGWDTGQLRVYGLQALMPGKSGLYTLLGTSRIAGVSFVAATMVWDANLDYMFLAFPDGGPEGDLDSITKDAPLVFGSNAEIDYIYVRGVIA